MTKKLSKTEQHLLDRMQLSPGRHTCITWGTYYGPGKPRPYGRREFRAAKSLLKKGLATLFQQDKSIYYKNGYGDHCYNTIIKLV